MVLSSLCGILHTVKFRGMVCRVALSRLRQFSQEPRAVKNRRVRVLNIVHVVSQVMKFWVPNRIIGIALLTIIALVILVLHLGGIVNLVESATELLFLVLGVLGTLAFQLIVWPERFAGQVGAQSEKPTAVEAMNVSVQPAPTVAQFPPRFQRIYGTDELLRVLEILKAKGGQWLNLVSGNPKDHDIFLVDQEACNYRTELFTLSMPYHKTWGASLHTRINAIHNELLSGSEELRKGRIEWGKAHIETALANVASLIEYLKSPTTN
jgi:hypothetical protein